MTNLTPELIAKAKAAKSAEELLELAKANGIELTEEEAKTFFAQLNTNGAVSDDDLEAVAGGGICETLMDLFRTGNRIEQPDAPACCHTFDKAPIESSMTPLPHDVSEKNKMEYL